MCMVEVLEHILTYSLPHIGKTLLLIVTLDKDSYHHLAKILMTNTVWKVTHFHRKRPNCFHNCPFLWKNQDELPGFVSVQSYHQSNIDIDQRRMIDQRNQNQKESNFSQLWSNLKTSFYKSSPIQYMTDQRHTFSCTNPIHANRLTWIDVILSVNGTFEISWLFEWNCTILLDELFCSAFERAVPILTDTATVFMFCTHVECLFFVIISKYQRYVSCHESKYNSESIYLLCSIESGYPEK